MRGNYRALLTIVFLFCLPAFASAQGLGINSNYLEFGAIGGGARAAGMGGAYLAIGEGEMAYSWNPAALTKTDKTKFGIQLASIGDKFSSVAAMNSQYYAQPNIQAVESKRNHFSLNNGGFTIPFEFMEREWAVGGGWRNVFDMITEYSYPGFGGSENSYSQDRGIDGITGAVAGKIVEEISMGIAINAYTRNSEYNYYEGGTIQYISQNNIDTSLVDYWANNNSHFNGANLDIGLSVDYGMVKGGVVVHTPYTLTQDIKLTESIIIPPVPVGAINRLKIKYDMPLAYSIGLAGVPMENLTIAADLYMSKLSNVDISRDWERADFADTSFNANWEDITQFRIGAEYSYDAGFADIPVRVGFRNEPSAAKELLDYSYDSVGDSTISVYGDQVTTNIITFGTGMYFDKIWFDLAYQFGSSSYTRSVDFGSPMDYEIKRDYSRLIISTGMYFY